MGRDRTSTVRIGALILSTDKDHKGYYRGNQAQDHHYRGWHYHIESRNYTQSKIMQCIAYYLTKNIKANRVEISLENLYIGTVEHEPEAYMCFQKDNKTVVLWLSGFNGKLHIEANKKATYTKNLLSKPDLIDFLLYVHVRTFLSDLSKIITKNNMPKIRESIKPKKYRQLTLF